MAGLDSTGFVANDVDSILAQLEGDEKNALGASLNVRPTSVVGVFNGVIATKLSELWDVGNDVWSSQNPDTAQGASLDQLCQLTGVSRLPALQSTVTLSLTGTPSTPIAALRRVKHNATGTFWTNPLSAVIGAASTVSVAFTSEDYGPIQALAGTLTIIDTPVSGWTTVTNPLDAAIGQDGESDADLRIRRTRLLSASGKATVDSIQAAMLGVAGVLAAKVLENPTSSTDANGLPSKSFEAIVDVGSAVATAIAQAVWNTKPIGISAYGTTTAAALDVLGGTRIMAYTPATSKNIYLAVTALTGSGFSGATADFVAAYESYEASLNIDDNVSYNALISRSFVTGVLDITALKVDIFSSPTATSNINIGLRERAKFDSSRTTVWLT